MSARPNRRGRPRETRALEKRPRARRGGASGGEGYWSYLFGLLLACCVLQLTAPTGGGFWPGDAPSHALGGVFVKDLLRDLPLADPAGYAAEYHLRHPALAVLLHPPLFYLVSAAFFAVLPDTQWTAQLAVSAHLLLLGGASFFLFRMFAPPALAFAGALLVLGAPGVAFWGRQVMLEVPAVAWLTLSALLLAGHLRQEEGGAGRLALAVLAFLASAHVTFVGVVFLPAAALLLLAKHGLAFLSRPGLLACALLLLVGMIPLSWHQIAFGPHNTPSAAGGGLAPTQVENWLWYARALPAAAGWPLIALAALGSLVLTRRAVAGRGQRPSERWLLPLAVAWFGYGYLFLSYAALKEERYALFLVVPLAMAAVRLLAVLPWPRAAQGAGVTIAVAAFGYSLVFVPAHWQSGPRQAAGLVARLAPPGSAVLYSGRGDGAFVFDLVAAGRDDLAVARDDGPSGESLPRRGLSPIGFAPPAPPLDEAVSDPATRFVVVEPEAWGDDAQMARFEATIEREGYELIRRIPVETNAPGAAGPTELRVFRRSNLEEARLDEPRGSAPSPVADADVEG